ncbi:carbohydrate kinase family protein [Candidatus Woesearchaeota archaeon]|nr:carbohydrate kinase family protein [Candidatus Woesearchaeota archaeon]
MPKYDVITLGSATLDVFVYTKNQDLIKVSGLDKRDLMAYPIGSKILIDELHFSIGGGSTNTATAFARLGLKTGCVCRLGNDDNSKHVLDFLKKEGIDFLGVQGEGYTDYSIILNSIAHDRTILTYKGQSNKLKFSDINASKLNTRWFYLGTMTGASFRCLEEFCAYASKNNALVAFNPSTYLAEKGLRFLSKVLKKTAVLVLNDEEAALLTGKKGIPEMLRALHKSGPGIVVITEGEKGAHASDGNSLYFAPAFKVKVVESTGAGDAFASTFVAGLAQRKPIEQALMMAMTNATSVITHPGAKEKLLTTGEMSTIMKKTKYSLEKQPL